MAIAAAILCVPVDMTGFTELPGIDIPARSFAQGDSKTKCQPCGRSVWIGGMQRAHRQLHPDALVICYFCMIAAMEAERERTGAIPSLNMHSLDPTR